MRQNFLILVIIIYSLFIDSNSYLSHRIVDSFSVHSQIKIYRINFNFVGTKQGYRDGTMGNLFNFMVIAEMP